MKKRRFNVLVTAAAIVLLSSCASRPVIDPYGVDMAQFQRDLEDCEAIAGQIDSGGQVAQSALLGALIGAAIGLVSYDVGGHAAAGAVTGGVAGAGAAHNEKAVVVRNCLYHRGYNVLN